MKYVNPGFGKRSHIIPICGIDRLPRLPRFVALIDPMAFMAMIIDIYISNVFAAVIEQTDSTALPNSINGV